MILYIRIRTANRVFVAWRKKKSIQSASLYSHCIIEDKCSSGKACGFEGGGGVGGGQGRRAFARHSRGWRI